MRLPVMPPVAPMLALAVPDVPPGWAYEPKWDGFRAIVFRDGDEVEISSRNGRPMGRYFPDVVAAARESLPERCVVDGEIIILQRAGRGLDFWALQQRLHPAPSRVRTLVASSTASFIAFDLLALGTVDYRPRPFRERRAALEFALAGAPPPIHLTPTTRDSHLAREWFTRFDGAGLDGLVAKDPDAPYVPGKRVMRKIKHQRTADCVVVGYRHHRSGPGMVGSVLVALHDDGQAPGVGSLEWADWPEWADLFGGLMPVGAVGALSNDRRRALLAELEPLVVPIAAHPWRAAVEAMAARGPKSNRSRWNAEASLDFVPLRPELVVEVRYDRLEGGRFRHPPQWVRWRPDRDAASCGYAQLERQGSIDVRAVLTMRT